MRKAFALRGMPEPKLSELQGIQAIGRFEGNYGAAFGSANNWGAVQCRSRPPCPQGCSEQTDTHADGTKYQGCYRIYGSPIEGAADMLREVYRREGVPAAMRAGNATAVATAMRAAGYFEAPVERYAKAIELNAGAIAKALGEPLKIKRRAASSAPTPTTTEDDTPAIIAGAFGFALLLFGIRRWKRNASIRV